LPTAAQPDAAAASATATATAQILPDSVPAYRLAERHHAL
jgi:hypothetical protein